MSDSILDTQITDSILKKLIPSQQPGEAGKRPCSCIKCKTTFKNYRRGDKIKHLKKCALFELQNEIDNNSINQATPLAPKTQSKIQNFFNPAEQTFKTQSLIKSKTGAKEFRGPTKEERQDLLSNLIFNAGWHAIHHCVTKAIIPLQEQARAKMIEQPGVCPKTLRKYLIQTSEFVLKSTLCDDFKGLELFMAFDVWSEKIKVSWLRVFRDSKSSIKKLTRNQCHS